MARRRALLPPVRLASRSSSYARGKGYIDLFERTGVEVIQPGCGACIGCGPGVSESRDQVTVSAINRNYQGRSGPGPAVPGLAADRRRLRGGGQDRRVPRGMFGKSPQA